MVTIGASRRTTTSGMVGAGTEAEKPRDPTSSGG
jgi:hypothetical protein